MYTNYSDNRYKRKKKEAKVIIFKQICTQVQTPRKASTMARRVLETPLPSSQKGQKNHSSPTHKQAFHSHRSHNPLHSSLSSTHSHCSLNPLRSSSSPTRAPLPAQHATTQHSEMPIIITTALRNWLTTPTPKRDGNRIED